MSPRILTAPLSAYPHRLEIVSHIGIVRVTATAGCKQATVTVQATSDDPAIVQAVRDTELSWDESRGVLNVNVPRLPGTVINAGRATIVNVGGGTVHIGNGTTIIGSTGFSGGVFNQVTMTGNVVSVSGTAAVGGIEIIAEVPEVCGLKFDGDHADLDCAGEYRTVDAHTQNGRITLGGVGNLEAKTATGDVTVEAIDGTARISTQTGNVRIGRTGDNTQVNTQTGNLRITDFGGSADLKSQTGDVTVHATEGGTLTVRSQTGDVRITATDQAQAAGLAIDARSTIGRTSIPQPANAPRTRSPRGGDQR